MGNDVILSFPVLETSYADRLFLKLPQLEGEGSVLKYVFHGQLLLF